MRCGLICPHLPFLAVWVRRTEGSYSIRAFGFSNEKLSVMSTNPHDPNKSRPLAILVLTGASGAGKTTLTLKLNELAIPGVKGFNCDRVKIESDEIAGSTDRQADILRYWISHLSQAETGIELAVLDTQIRPHRALEVLSQAAVDYAQIVLVDCDQAKRNERLHTDRGQPELANPRMDCWAAYLRGQADALRLSIIDTSNDPIDKSLVELEVIVRDLLTRARSS